MRQILYEGSKPFFFAVCGAVAIGSVSSHIVGSIFSKYCYIRSKTSCTTTIVCFFIAYCRIRRGAPAYASCSNSGTSIRSYISSTYRCICGYRSYVCSSYLRYRNSSKTLLFAVACAIFVGGVCSNIVGGTFCKSAYIRLKTSFSFSINSMIIFYGRVWRSAPAYTSCRKFPSLFHHHFAATFGCRCGNIRYVGSSNHRFSHYSIFRWSKVFLYATYKQ